jgi:hypothetical protein
MNLFKKMTNNHEAILDARAERQSNTAKRQQQAIIANLEEEKAQLEEKIEDILDLGVRDTTSLVPPKMEEGAMERVQSYKVKLREIEVRLQVANETLAKLFSK